MVTRIAVGRPILLTGGLVLAFLAQSVPASATRTTFTVDSTVDAPDANPGDEHCASADGECTLRAAIMEVNALAAPRPPFSGPYRIHIDEAGTYTLDLVGAGEDAAATGDLDINNARLVIRNTSCGHVTIDGNHTDRVFDLGPLAPADLTIRGWIVIRNGKAESVPINTTTDVGGGLQIRRNSILDMRDVLFTGNRAGARGGAVGSPVSAGIPAGGTGTTTLHRVFLVGNSAGVEAGGFFSNRVATAKRVWVLNNQVTGTVGNERGGGIANSGVLTLLHVTVSGNSLAAGNGGGIGNRGDPVALVFGNITMNNVTIDHNQAPQGGGIGNNGIMNLTNVTISENAATLGGGIINGPQGTPALSYVTLSGNSALGVGGGILSQAPLRVRGTIVANSPSGGNCVGAVVSLGDNLSSDGTCNFVAPGDQVNTDPMLGPLAFNGGPTRTHRLLRGSPAVDAVVANPCPPPETDQRGAHRPRDGDGDGTARCDTGAYERRSH